MINLIAIYTIKQCCTFDIHHTPHSHACRCTIFLSSFLQTTVNKHSFSLRSYFWHLFGKTSSFRNGKCSKFTITFDDNIKKFVRPEKSTISGFFGVHSKKFYHFCHLFHTFFFIIPQFHIWLIVKMVFQSFDFNNRQFPQFQLCELPTHFQEPKYRSTKGTPASGYSL